VAHGLVADMRELICDRWMLLRLLVATGVGATARLAAVMIGVTVLPAATAAATGALVGSVVEVSEQGAALGSIVPSLVAVGALLVVDLTAQSLLMPIRDHAAMRVNGVIRERVRQHLGRPASIDHLEDQRVRELSSLAVQDRWLFNIGAAAEGQLWLIARFVGALGTAALLATYSSLLALFSLAALLTQRAILRRQYATAVGRVIDEAVAAERAASYWQQVTTTPKGAKELRLFGFDGWAVGKYMEPLTTLARIEIDRLARALPRQWITFVLSGLATGVPFVVLTRAALSGDVSTGQLALLLGATIGLTPIGAMGYEAFSIEAAIPQLHALRELSALPAEPGGAATTDSVAPRIAFEGVSFRYPGSPTTCSRSWIS
jgi:ATP-binding cassette subfamily B protein